MRASRKISGCTVVVIMLMAGAGSGVGLIAQPSNDLPCNAILLTESESCDFSVYTNMDATGSGIQDPGCGSYAGGDIWFMVIVPADSSFEIQTDTEAEAQFPDNNGWMYRAALGLYEGSCGTLNSFGCYENNGLFHPRMSGATVTGKNPGDTIWIRIWENSNNDIGMIRVCVADTIEIEEEGPLPFNVTGGGSYCQGDTGISVELSGSESGVLYTLLLNDTIRRDTLTGNGGSLAWSPVTAEGSYTIEAEDPVDFSTRLMTGSTVVSILGLPQITSNAVSITCFGDDDGSISLPVTSEYPFAVEWTGTGGYASGDQHLTGLPPGDYNATVTDSNNCVAMSQAITITEPELLEATVDKVNHLSEYDANDGSVDLDISGGTPPYLISWEGTDGFTSSEKDPSAMSLGYYDVMVTDNHLCADSINMIGMTLNEDPDGIFIPEGFSPNGDGFNDRFVIVGIEHFPENELMVFNRQGVTILHRVNYMNNWNGIPEKGGVLGGELPEGTYYYIFKFGESEIRKGYVYINRE